MSDRLLVATRKGLFTLDRAGGDWKITQTAFLGDHCPMVLADSRDGTYYAALQHGHFGPKLHRSDNRGESWEEVAAPTYPERPADAEPEINPFNKREIPWKTQLTWELQPGGPDQRDRLWCGTIPGGLFRSDNRGESWELVRSLWDRPERVNWFGGGFDFAGIHSVCVDPRNPDHIDLGVSCGGVWSTRDGGKSWQINADGMRAEYMPPDQQYNPHIQDPHLITRCTAAPDHLWAQHHNGIFRTTDNCKSWTEIAKPAVSGFGFAVAVHPRDPETAWFVPALKDEHRIPVDGKVCVTRTRDGGKSFDVLCEGLPQEHAYDLTFRHALAVDEGGEQLAFGTTTGNLFVSESAGDRWQALSKHLPPIYCVRYAS